VKKNGNALFTLAQKEKKRNTLKIAKSWTNFLHQKKWMENVYTPPSYTLIGSSFLV
jgi:hypothetical protein